MPRGVYDRSKAKKKGAAKAEAVSAAPKQKRAYTKRAQAAVPGIPGQVAQVGNYDFNTITQLRELAQIRSVGVTQVDGLIKKLIGKLEADFDATNITAVSASPETKANGKAAKSPSELPSPVPFVVPSASAPTPS